MSKLELVAYLHHLHILMQAIDPTPAWVAKEYQVHWDRLKETVKKEQDDETRT